jgi:hypothetical protein
MARASLEEGHRVINNTPAMDTRNREARQIDLVDLAVDLDE